MTHRTSNDRAARPDAAIGAPPVGGAGAPTAPEGAPVTGAVTGRWWHAPGRHDDPFIPLLVMLRWGCLIVAILGLPVALVRDADAGAITAIVLGLVHATMRTLFPVTGIGDPGAPARIRWRSWTLDLVATAAAVAVSGGLSSPFLLTVPVEVLTAGLCAGYAGGALASALASTAVLVPELAHTGSQDLDTVAPLALVLVLTTAVAGYSRSLFIEASHRESETSGRLEQLTEVNRLLLLLHGLAQSLPESLDLRETIESARDRLRELLDCDSVVVLVHEESTDMWSTLLAEGSRPAASFARTTLPGVLAEAERAPAVVLVPEFAEGTGLSSRARSGMYVALPARGRVVGLLAVEHHEPGRYGTAEQRLLTGLADSLGLAIDNARWFRRLRALGAEEERTRIARDLHDRLAQSLVYITFELDRIVRRRGPDPELERMRDDVRRAVGELRETLVQLRTTVSDSQSFELAAQDLVERFERRTAIETELAVQRDDRTLPHRVEQEVLRILQEALSNVERHADATACTVTWTVDDGRARLEVRDDGKGFDGPEGRADSFGIVGMYERADAIGASLRIDSRQGAGTTVTVELALTEVFA
jgi:signal transduction histidine kinase